MMVTGIPTSRVLDRLRQGQYAFCTKINLADSRVVELASLAGFDCVWLDMEHIANDGRSVEQQIQTARMHGMDAMVRVARSSEYRQYFEIGAAGIMVPHVMSLADAQMVVRSVRFAPLGNRQVDRGYTAGGYGRTSIEDYIKTANRDRFLMLQIEDYEPLEELDAIAQLEGVDIIFFGRHDFSHSIGAPGQYDHPEVIKAYQLVAQVALKHGKFAGAATNIKGIDGLKRLGYRFFSVGADVVGLGQYYKNILQELKNKE